MNKFFQWIEARLPIRRFWNSQISGYYAPKNLNFWYFFGSLALLLIVNQFLTGLWLTMFYTPSVTEAFNSIEYIMRDVNYGWLLRYMHATGASALFIVVYLHVFRNLLYGSYHKPRELLWLFGMVLYVLLLMEAFFGYLLPWGQMSYWGAQVITSLFSAIPFIGKGLVTWLRGDYTVGNPTLQRFFALHVIGVPLILLGFILLHVIALRQTGSNNPDGIEIKQNLDGAGHPRDGIPFHPYYTIKDLVGALGFLIAFFAIVFFMPEMGGYFLEPDNFAPANPLSTPDHIAPVWYLTPFYSMLRAVPDKLTGVIVMAASIVLLFILPWLDYSPVKSMRYRGWGSRIALALFVISFILLGYLGTVPVTPIKQTLARLATIFYFAYFIFMPLYTRVETCYPVPERLSK